MSHRNVLRASLLVATTGTFFLTGCNLFSSPPDALHMYVNNRGYTFEDVAVCSSGLKATMRIGSASLDATAPAEEERKIHERTPDDAPFGTVATVEAFCYGEGGAELGYAKVEKGWHAGNIAVVSVIMVPEEFVETTCLPASTKRGVAPCVISDLLE